MLAFWVGLIIGWFIGGTISTLLFIHIFGNENLNGDTYEQTYRRRANQAH